MYRVSVDSEDSYMLVMRNMFSHRLPVHRKYDLKVRREGPRGGAAGEGAACFVLKEGGCGLEDLSWEAGSHCAFSPFC